MSASVGWSHSDIREVLAALSERGYIFDTFIPQVQGVTIWFLVGGQSGRLVPSSIWTKTPEDFIKRLTETNYGPSVDGRERLKL